MLACSRINCFEIVDLTVQTAVKLWFSDFCKPLLKRITTAAAVSVVGVLEESQGKGQKFDLIVQEIEILGDADPDEVSKTVMQPKKHSLEFLREQAHLRFRTNLFGAVFRFTME